MGIYVLGQNKCDAHSSGFCYPENLAGKRDNNNNGRTLTMRSTSCGLWLPWGTWTLTMRCTLNTSLGTVAAMGHTNSLESTLFTWLKLDASWLITPPPPPCNHAPALEPTLWLYTFGYIHYSIVFNAQNMETNYIFVGGKIAKNIPVHVCNGILVSLEDDRDFAICDNKDKM